MTPADIIEEAAKEGVRLMLSDNDKGIRAAGKRDVVADWLPIIQQHKAGLLQWLIAHTDKATDCPSLVRCRDCQHFMPDAIGSGQGIGSCTKGQAASKRSLLWPGVQRPCSEWRGISA